MKKEASKGKEGTAKFGMTERYDRASVGMMPFRYWDEDNYSEWKENGPAQS